MKQCHFPDVNRNICYNTHTEPLFTVMKKFSFYIVCFVILFSSFETIEEFIWMIVEIAKQWKIVNEFNYFKPSAKPCSYRALALTLLDRSKTLCFFDTSVDAGADIWSYWKLKSMYSFKARVNADAWCGYTLTTDLRA